jgi:competence protein ComEC
MDSVNLQPGRAFPVRASAPVLPSAIRRVPAVERAGMLPWAPFWLGLGIGGWFLLRDEPGLTFYAALGLGACVCLIGSAVLRRFAERGHCDWFWADRSHLAAMAVLLVVLGAGLIGLRAHMVAAPVLEFRYYGPVEGRVIGIDRSSSDSMRLLLDRVALRDVPPERVPARVRVSLKNAQRPPIPGQRVMMTAHLGPPGGPSEPDGFDFRRLAWFEQLGAIGYVRTPVMTVAMPDGDSALALHRLRMSLAETMRSRIGGQEGAVSAALVTGDRSGISEQTNAIMRASNLYHIISISGLHMSMLAGFVYAALRSAGAVAQGLGLGRGMVLHKFAAAAALAVAALYLWISGGGVATERSFIMIAVMLIAIIADRRAVSLRTVAVAAMLVLLLAPEALTEPGFQMSFAATVALILVHDKWLVLSPRLPWWLRPVAMLLLSSAVAGLATSPIAAIHFGRMTQYGMLANLLVVPVVGVLVMPGAVFAMLLAPLGLAQPALWLMGLGTQWMLWVAAWVAGLHGAVALLPAPPWFVLPLLGAGAVLMFLGPLAAAGLGRAGWPRRFLGAALVAVSALVWFRSERPFVLISSDGEAVAAMTEAGRVPSKPRGGAFTVRNWLEADGDPADQIGAASRGLWTGPLSDRRASLPFPGGMLQLRHLTGKAAAGVDRLVCSGPTIVVADRDLAVAVVIHRGRIRLQPGADRGTGRVWQ